MPKTTFPRDRFDDLADESGRVGAHRAENPRMRGGAIFLWAVAAVVLLTVAGIFATLLISGRISLTPEAEPTAAPAPVVVPVLDTTSTVIVLNASGQPGLATAVKDTLVSAGWPAESVFPGDASSGFDTTTVYYSLPEDEAAAAGVAEAIGGADVQQSSVYDAYPVEDDPDTDTNETDALRFVVVVGADRATGETPTVEQTAG
ncbi:LytR C-terminal domain-containing protein [Microbacterium sp. P05]|uniref:LytR C-terminal domain-containing protein n=1 Tax=Microbacterium sp. P05 TaxID=3366948 RepID=UPI0037464506